MAFTIPPPRDWDLDGPYLRRLFSTYQRDRTPLVLWLFPEGVTPSIPPNPPHPHRLSLPLPQALASLRTSARPPKPTPGRRGTPCCNTSFSRGARSATSMFRSLFVFPGHGIFDPNWPHTCSRAFGVYASPHWDIFSRFNTLPSVHHHGGPHRVLCFKRTDKSVTQASIHHVPSCTTTWVFYAF